MSRATRRGLVAACALSGAALIPVAADATAATAASTPPATPTPRQIARAVSRAEASPDLWATINICSSSRSGEVVGIRGQMPALGLRSTLLMTVSLQAWSAARRQYTTIASPNAVNHIRIGAYVTGLQQAGAEFPFHAGTTGQWRASVTFAWVRAGRLLGRVTRTTTGSHPTADFSRPPHYSAATCRIG